MPAIAAHRRAGGGTRGERLLRLIGQSAEVAVSLAAVAPSATEICGGVLDAGASAALEELTASQSFSEDDRVGGEQIVPVAAAATALKSGPKTRSYLCAGKASDSHTTGNFQISARWEQSKPGDQRWASDDHWSAFDVAGAGRKTAEFPYASASAKSGVLEFTCPVGPGKQNGMLLSVDMMSFLLAQSDTEGKAPELLVRVMHPIAKSLAQQMGCLTVSQLPTTLGEPTPLPPVK
ncbi:hypothetical protein [Streptomyces sp. NPDC020681]|uniref:hypothetical protein n=1 Tax=Streptomyces sp. NPDC020681 TaxID=3365083 RepID=UPI00379E89D8